jgi:Uma2 family endonuclease
MAMPLPVTPREPGHWTIADLERLPADGNRYEIIDGVLYVSPAPSLTHQRACLELYVALRAYLEQHRIGEAFLTPADLEYSRDTLVEPDLMVLPTANGPLPQRWRGSDGVLLAVEILSPSTARKDRGEKRALYQREHTPEYWIVDLDARLVERWRPADERPEILVERLTWVPATAAEPFVLPLPGYFARVWGD